MAKAKSKAKTRAPSQIERLRQDIESTQAGMYGALGVIDGNFQQIEKNFGLIADVLGDETTVDRPIPLQIRELHDEIAGLREYVEAQEERVAVALARSAAAYDIAKQLQFEEQIKLTKPTLRDRITYAWLNLRDRWITR